jgi:phage terminase small subunit
MPPEERKERGTYRSDRDPAAGTAQLPPGMPSLPSGMPDDARKLWRKIAKKLLAAGLLSDMDGTTLERYCRAYAVWRKLIALVETADVKAAAERRGGGSGKS